MQSSNRRRRFSKRFVLTLLQLEDRTVPAGNVTANVVNGTLVVTGDDAANLIWIGGIGEQAGIMPGPGTTVNGSTAVAAFDHITNGYMVSMGGGDDVVGIGGDVAGGNLIVDMGAGNDIFNGIGLTLQGLTVINAGDGADTVTIQSSAMNGNTYIVMGAGDDQLNVLNTANTGLVLVDGGTGTNGLDVTGSTSTTLPAIMNFGASTTTPAVTAPTANDDTANVTADGSVTINVAANDTAGSTPLDLASINIVSQPSSGTAVVNNDGTVSYTSAATQNGVDSFSYTIRDTDGTVSNTADVTINVSAAAAPTVTLATTANSSTNVSPIPFTATFSSAVTGFTAAGLNVTNGTPSDPQTTDNIHFTFTVTPGQQGPVAVFVMAGAASSTGSQNTQSNTVTVTFDTTAPVVAANPLSTNSNAPTVTGTVDDSTATVSVTVNGQMVNATVSGNNWSAAIPGPLADGAYDIAVSATDAAGNVGSATLTGGLVVDMTPPAVAINPAAAVPISGTSSDAGTGVTHVGVSINNGSGFWNGTDFSSQTEIFNDATTTDNFANWNFAFAVPGSYTVRAEATDAVGNNGFDSQSVTVV